MDDEDNDDNDDDDDDDDDDEEEEEEEEEESALTEFVQITVTDTDDQIAAANDCSSGIRVVLAVYAALVRVRKL